VRGGAAPSLPNSVDLYWLPLGAGGRVVARCGRLYDGVVAVCEHRHPRPLFHSALEVVVDGVPHVIEMAPVWAVDEDDRGVVKEGPVGLRALGRFRTFRYEVRRWRDGRIPDRAWAVGSPRRLSDDRLVAGRLLALVPSVPALTWGRDELGAGEMWNSNSLVSWLLASSGLDLTGVVPPHGGRAPGWAAGLLLARAGGELRRSSGRRRDVRLCPAGCRGTTLEA
jgi:hypothetical protein